MSRARRIRNRVLRRILEAGQRLGINLTPKHFYSQVPDVRQLRRTEHWRRPFSMTGVLGAEPERQLAWVEEIVSSQSRADGYTEGVYVEACELNETVGFGPIEAEFLYYLALARRPGKVIQVGAGVSTAVLLRAREHGRLETEIVSIDPHPTVFLRDAAARGEIALIPEPAEKLPPEDLAAVGQGGLLFVDSTHAVRPGGEVNRIILEVLPRLPAGSIAHFHDIVFPYDYGPGVLGDDLFFWAESPLLHAFLVGNPRFTLRASFSMLHHLDPAGLQRVMPSYRPVPTETGLSSADLGLHSHFPTSAYLEAID